MNHPFNPEMLILGREVRGVTQKALADLTGIAQGTISKYETGIIRGVKQEDLAGIARVLGFPTSFFYRPGGIKPVEATSVFHRKRQTITKGNLSKVDAAINLLRMDATRLFQAADVEPALSIPNYPLVNYENDPEYIASLVRSAWGIPTVPGPIPSMVGYMEAAGCLVLLMPFETDKMDAVSQWEYPEPPVILMSNSINGERQRFSLAHELGHLVMHRGITIYGEMESEADAFASAFLMPADRMLLDLPPVSLERMLQIKAFWKVSVQSLIRRSKDLDIISERRYTNMLIELSKMGYRTREPFPLPAERPTLLTSLLEHLQSRLEHNVQDIANLLNLYQEDLLTRYAKPQNELHIVPKPSPTPKSSSIKRKLSGDT